METTKCPICGCNEFVSMDEPIYDQYARISGECYVCAECGYVFWFNKGYIQFVKDRKRSIVELEEEIKSLMEQKEQLAQNINNIDPYKSRLKEYKKELEQRIAWGEGGSKKCRAIEESISELSAIVDAGVNVEIVDSIKNLESKIYGLNAHKDELYRPIRPIRMYN